MFKHSEDEEFERAAILRDNISILKAFVDQALQENAEFTDQKTNADIISFYRGDVEVDLAIYIMRKGILLGHKNFNFSADTAGESFEESVLNFLFQYYNQSHDDLPNKVILPLGKEHVGLLDLALKGLSEQPIDVLAEKEEFNSLIKLTTEQAYEHQRVRLTNQDSVYVGLNRLKELLKLRERPQKLECYDIAIFQGKNPAASQIVFIDGEPRKSLYRHYNLTELEEGNNDFEMMRETLRRRIKHGDLPDVFIVDGGKGQVSSFNQVLKEFDLDVPVVGIAKDKTKSDFKSSQVKSSGERLIISGRSNPYHLNKCPPLFRIVTQMRDEAHRFSRRLHHKGQRKDLFTSWLDQVPGIGPKTKEKILKKNNLAFSDWKKMGWREISSTFEINKTVAQNIEKVLCQTDDDDPSNE